MGTTFKATIEHVNHTTSRVAVRTHTVLVDRGIAKGGLDLGPAGGEYLLVSLGGCFTSHLVAAIRTREAAVSNVRVAVTGTMDGARSGSRRSRWISRPNVRTPSLSAS
jgi:putative redox protein